jgi:hypothetical protein
LSVCIFQRYQGLEKKGKLEKGHQRKITKIRKMECMVSNFFIVVQSGVLYGIY